MPGVAAATEPTGVQRMVLGNGLRVIVDRHAELGVTAVTVVYDVGASSDPPGENGISHVVEHLMFQGSANFEALSHFDHVQRLGGQVNGQTHFDFTEYFQELSSEGVDGLLAMEADRMHGFVVTEDSFAREIEVVKEEVRTGSNNPLRNFPWKWLAPRLYPSLPSGYDAAGRLCDIDSLTLRRAEEFFAEYYCPGNAVLVLSGEVDDQLTETVERLFGSIPPRPVPSRRVDRTGGDGHYRVTEPAIPVAACAAARVADGGHGTRIDVALELLASLLQLNVTNRMKSGATGDTSLRISHGMFDEGVNCLAPPTLALCGIGRDSSADLVSEVLQEELEGVAAGTFAADTMELVLKRLRIAHLQAMDSPLMRSRRLALGELKGDGAVDPLVTAETLAGLERADVAGAAAALLDGPQLSIQLVDEKEGR